jgi:hypothetical protein
MQRKFEVRTSVGDSTKSNTTFLSYNSYHPVSVLDVVLGNDGALTVDEITPSEEEYWDDSMLLVSID